MNANLDTMPPRLREGALTDDDRMLYLMDEISRGARRAYDARIAKSGLNQTQWRIIGQLLREPSLTQAGIAKRLELESATIGQAVAGLCEKGLMERRRAKNGRPGMAAHPDPGARQVVAPTERIRGRAA